MRIDCKVKAIYLYGNMRDVNAMEMEYDKGNTRADANSTEFVRIVYIYREADSGRYVLNVHCVGVENLR